ncbi:Tol-Pal system beta propeller repeat protein TolB [Brevundimonas sp.]|uniref:Tol-Pal system beta propeller repeat protein TolB n=1 Tax=Brevundimonas sp. TaxID=1871086 RepID=UPI0025E75617|nr:Tol-Pal system beta propeller repeat protein TolB [Brevundimonas sp.]
MRLIALVAAALVGLTLIAPATAARAQTPEVVIDEGVIRAMPIAIAPFQGQYGNEISEVISANLERSGFFDPIDPAAFIERSPSVDVQPQFASWTAINAQTLLVGRVSIGPDGRLRAAFRLWDVVQQTPLLEFQFTSTPENWRRVAHKISDAVYQRLTGELGYFDTRIVFIAEDGRGPGRQTRLAVMDQDGFNPVYLAATDAILMTPRFSATHQRVTYMALGEDYTRIYLLDLETGRQESIGEFDGLVFAPRFSPDGRRIAFSLERGGNSDIYVMNLQSRQLSRLTSDPGIDTSPSFSPDGSRIVFNSDRGGRPRLYVMNSDGSGQRAISGGSGNYHTPVWSPCGDLVAFTKQQGGRFHIGVMNPDGTGERILSSSYYQEGPSWAPNGRYLVFFRGEAGESPRLYTVDVTGRILRPAPYAGAASDPAWSPLLDPPAGDFSGGGSGGRCLAGS